MKSHGLMVRGITYDLNREVNSQGDRILTATLLNQLVAATPPHGGSKSARGAALLHAATPSGHHVPIGMPDPEGVAACSCGEYYGSPDRRTAGSQQSTRLSRGITFDRLGGFHATTGSVPPFTTLSLGVGRRFAPAQSGVRDGGQGRGFRLRAPTGTTAVHGCAGQRAASAWCCTARCVHARCAPRSVQ